MPGVTKEERPALLHSWLPIVLGVCEVGVAGPLSVAISFIFGPTPSHYVLMNTDLSSPLILCLAILICIHEKNT